MEVTLKSVPRADGSQLTLLTFAQAYGFRNIQNVMRKIKQGKCQYDYVELMACPSGCVNGGGQVKLSQYEVQQRPEENADLVKTVSAILAQGWSHQTTELSKAALNELIEKAKLAQ